MGCEIPVQPTNPCAVTEAISVESVVAYPCTVVRRQYAFKPLVIVFKPTRAFPNTSLLTNFYAGGFEFHPSRKNNKKRGTQENMRKPKLDNEK